MSMSSRKSQFNYRLLPIIHYSMLCQMHEVATENVNPCKAKVTDNKARNLSCKAAFNFWEAATKHTIFYVQPQYMFCDPQ